MDKKASYRFYRFCFKLVNPFIRFFRPFSVAGSENMIKGAALVCSNHSAMIDPFLIALAFGVDSHTHVIAKIELFRIPVISAILWKLGMIPVDRSIRDVASIKSSLTCLKKGEKVVVFPEGTRASEHDAGNAKNGAVKLAEHSGVPIIPVFVPRRKPFFIRKRIVFGTPYFIYKTDSKRTVEDYTKLTEDLMNKIQALGESNL
jgi:1-acyl-sn-glycerol-3-phosphate acyltransferase